MLLNVESCICGLKHITFCNYVQLCHFIIVVVVVVLVVVVVGVGVGEGVVVVVVVIVAVSTSNFSTLAM